MAKQYRLFIDGRLVSAFSNRDAALAYLARTGADKREWELLDDSDAAS